MSKLSMKTNYDNNNNFIGVSFSGLKGTETVTNVKEALEYLKINNPINADAPSPEQLILSNLWVNLEQFNPQEFVENIKKDKQQLLNGDESYVIKKKDSENTVKEMNVVSLLSNAMLAIQQMFLELQIEDAGHNVASSIQPPLVTSGHITHIYESAKWGAYAIITEDKTNINYIIPSRSYAYLMKQGHGELGRHFEFRPKINRNNTRLAADLRLIF